MLHRSERLLCLVAAGARTRGRGLFWPHPHFAIQSERKDAASYIAAVDNLPFLRVSPGCQRDVSCQLRTLTSIYMYHLADCSYCLDTVPCLALNARPQFKCRVKESIEGGTTSMPAHTG